jgi:hypothetical protein
MRRLCATGAAVLVCLALGVPALAQAASGEPSASAEPYTDFVTGTGMCRYHEPAMSVFIDWGRHDQAGFTCDWETDDPRVSGPGEGTWNVGCWDGVRVCLYWGDMTITGPDGTWVGAFTGQDTRTLAGLGRGTAAFQQVLEGTGAYEGWTYLAHLLFNDYTMFVDGIVYEGTPLPWAPMPWGSPSPTSE